MQKTIDIRLFDPKLGVCSNRTCSYNFFLLGIWRLYFDFSILSKIDKDSLVCNSEKTDTHSIYDAKEGNTG